MCNPIGTGVRSSPAPRTAPQPVGLIFEFERLIYGAIIGKLTRSRRQFGGLHQECGDFRVGTRVHRCRCYTHFHAMRKFPSMLHSRSHMRARRPCRVYTGEMGDR
jgi:hypothetical protein